MAKKATKHEQTAKRLAKAERSGRKKKSRLRKAEPVGAWGAYPDKAPNWRYSRHGVTQGFINSWLECRENARLKYMVGLQRSGFKAAIAFGLKFHDVLSTVTTYQGPATASNKIKKELNALRKNVSADGPLTPSEQEEVESSFGIIEVLLNRYLEHWSDVDEGIEWLAREDVFQTPYLDTFLTGRWDGVFLQNNRLWVHETKTKANVDASGLQASLHLDIQSMMYLFAAFQHFRNENPSLKLGGILYDVIKRPSIKQTKKETIEQYLNRLHDDIGSRPDFYFYRWRVPVNQTQLRFWERNVLRPIISSISLWYYGFFQKVEYDAVSSFGKEDVSSLRADPYENPYHYFNPGALFTKYGRSDLFDLFTRGDASGFEYKAPDIPFPELVD